MADDEREVLEVADSSHLTDADWAEINNLKRIYDKGGQEAISKRMRELSESDPIRYVTVIGAFFPDMMREAIKDSMAAIGLEEEDVREMAQKLEGSGKKH